VVIDGCPIYPSPSSGQTIVPLTNNTIIEINKKRFRFEYPPKHYRATLTAQINTPTVASSSRSRTLRLSMIQSAEVFSSRPDPDPRVNLRTLKTPIRTSPLKQSSKMIEDDEAPIILVDGNHPRVVEEDKDLVILEDVVRPDDTAPAASPLSTLPIIPRQQQQFSTPSRRPPRNSLHRAVLIRSAQRAALRGQDREKEEEEREEHHAVEMIVEESTEHDNKAEMDNVDAEDVFFGDESEDGAEDRDRSLNTAFQRGVEAFRNGWKAVSRSASPEKDFDEDNHDQRNIQKHESGSRVATPRRTPQRPPDTFASPIPTSRPSSQGPSLADRVKGVGRFPARRLSDAKASHDDSDAWKIREIDVQNNYPSEQAPARSSPRISNEERKVLQ
jgi:hypothetical protein